ncbi:hypothetical protein AB0H36_27655 [Kribbella sp. NPDC050820]|uniref:hypothetical protein n=1 Tax=Kribbella sp. NPDC050820 TaxID=3155408 RepID=UPI0033E615A2
MIAGLDTRPIGRVTSVQTINRHVARILTQWREGQASGPLWFGRNRRPEAVILPGDLGRAVADAAMDSIDLDRASELQLRAVSPRLAPEKLTELCGDAVQAALIAGACKPAARELAALQETDPDLIPSLIGHLAQGADQAAVTRLPDVTRRIAHRDPATWISYWSSNDGALLALVPAPTWLRRLVATGPQEPPPHSGPERAENP